MKKKLSLNLHMISRNRAVGQVKRVSQRIQNKAKDKAKYNCRYGFNFATLTWQKVKCRQCRHFKNLFNNVHRLV